MSKQSDTYICKDDIYPHYGQNTRPSRVYRPHYEYTQKDKKERNVSKSHAAADN